ncbi:unnamed protein product [Linum trigynum]|uniref:Uncharacterized protein n=1 Tax=Linum trigynum TaxID=586398 RepID=A0AAV2FU63_9ROSI
MGKRKQRDEDMDGACSKTYTYGKEELDKPFADYIMELVEKGQIVDANCKNGAYKKQLKKLLQGKSVGMQVKAYPNIEGRFKKLKKRWHAITFMRKKVVGDGARSINALYVPRDLGMILRRSTQAAEG